MRTVKSICRSANITLTTQSAKCSVGSDCESSCPKVRAQLGKEVPLAIQRAGVWPQTVQEEKAHIC